MPSTVPSIVASVATMNATGIVPVSCTPFTDRLWNENTPICPSEVVTFS